MNSFTDTWFYAFSISLIALAALVLFPRTRRVVRSCLLLVLVVTALFMQAASVFAEGLTSTTETNASWLLVALITLPCIAGVALMLGSLKYRQLCHRLCGLFMGAELLLATRLFEAESADAWQFQWIQPWFSPLGIRLHWAVDGLSFWLVLLLLLSMPLLWLAQDSPKKVGPEIPGPLLLLFQGALLSAFLAVDLFVQFLSLDLAVLMLFLMPAFSQKRSSISMKFLLFALLGSMLRWSCLSYLIYLNAQVTGHYSSDLVVLSHLVPTETASWWCYGSLSLSFLMLVPVFPVHHWLTESRQTPILGFLVSGLLSAFGAYGYIRVCMGLMPGPAGQMSAFFATATLLMGSFYALLLMRRAYSLYDWLFFSAFAIGGLALLGVFAATEASLNGTLLLLLSRGLCLAALAVICRSLEARSVDLGLKDLNHLSIAGLCGLPGSLSWVAQYMIISGTFMAHHATLARFGHVQGILGVLAFFCLAVSGVRLIVRIGLTNKKRSSSHAAQRLSPVTGRENLVLSVLIVCSIGCGLFPQVMLQRITPTISAQLRRFTEGRREFAQQEGGLPARSLPLKGTLKETGYPKHLSGADVIASPERKKR